MFGT
jgi:hypothetical protein